jgi:hypothetical protein
MFKSLLVMGLFVSGSVLAQDMSTTEDMGTAYREMPDGSSRYVGKCLTHEDYEKINYKISKTVLDTITPSELPKKMLASILAKFDSVLISEVLNNLDIYDMADRGASRVSIFQDFIDDLTVETLSLANREDLKLIRFNVGVGGGNGAYLVFNELMVSGSKKYQLMSFTFDGELNSCDLKVWKR